MDFFKTFTDNDLAILNKYLPSAGSGDCDLTVPSLWSRNDKRRLRFAEKNDFLILERALVGVDSPVIVMPMGVGEVPQSIFNELAQDAAAKNRPLIFYGLIDEMRPILSEAYPGRTLTIEDNPDRWDYVYNCQDFVELAGSHFHGKRNFVKRFYKACPDAEFVVYTPEYFEACMDFLHSWYAEREPDEDLQYEFKAIKKVLTHWETLAVYGGMLIDHGRILGMTYGARCAPDMLAVHIEKATREVPGAYPTLAQAFATTLPPCIEYLNREEDLGIPGLRKAKQDWHPVTQLKKGTIIVR